MLISHFGFLQAQYTAIPDSAFENFLEDNGMGDGIPNNGLVLTANIENVTHLDLPSFAGVSDMTGIEDFTTLEFLDFSYNTVSNIDLSQNINLSIFGCAFNQLTSLDLSNNMQLEMIACFVNQINSLQLNSSFLHTLECYENQITTLDLSFCPLLTDIDCHTNSISVLNLTACTELITLTAWDNQLTFLDVSQNIKLQHLRIPYNNIASIDLSNNILLELFRSTYGNFEILDFSNNPNLGSVGCGYNPQLSYLDIRNGNNENISLFAANDSNLECIYVDDAEASYLENWHIDTTTTFVNNEAECESLHDDEFFDMADHVRLFPNPTKDYIAISLKKNARYRLLDCNGKNIVNGLFTIGLNSLNISNLPNGIYVLRIELDTSVITKKIIKSE